LPNHKLSQHPWCLPSKPAGGAKGGRDGAHPHVAFVESNAMGFRISGEPAWQRMPERGQPVGSRHLSQGRREKGPLSWSPTRTHYAGGNQTRQAARGLTPSAHRVCLAVMGVITAKCPAARRASRVSTQPAAQVATKPGPAQTRPTWGPSTSWIRVENLVVGNHDPFFVRHRRSERSHGHELDELGIARMFEALRVKGGAKSTSPRSFR